ncbi:MAG: ABC transporter substrate-binding protein [Alphaproteobacteria bacterium]
MTKMFDPTPPIITRRTMLKGTAAAVIGLAPVIGGKRNARAADPKTLVVAAPSTPQSLDTQFEGALGTIDAAGALYDSLIEYQKAPDPKVPAVRRENLEPDGVKDKLAKSWEVADGGLTTRFFLKEGVKSNWGNELTADDVKYTYDRKFAAGGMGPFFTSVIGLSKPEQVKVEGRYVVSFITERPNPISVIAHTNLYNPILDGAKCKEMASDDDPWARSFLDNDTAGFGPYVMQQLARGQQAVFAARKDYYGDAPYFDTVIVREVPSSASRVSLLQGGAVDIAQFLDPAEYKSLAKADDVAVETVAASSQLWAFMNIKEKPFDSKLVRQAMNYVFPHAIMLNTVFYDLAEKQIACMPLFYPMVRKDLWRYDTDPDKARALLAEAGYPDGFETEITYNAGDPNQERIAILFQTALREINVKLSLKKVPADIFFNFVADREHKMIFYNDAAWTADPGYALQLYFYSTTHNNYGNWANQEFDELIDRGRTVIDPAEREKIYSRAQEIVMDECPWLFMAYTNFTLAHRADVQGWTYYTSNNLRFQDFHRQT